MDIEVFLYALATICLIALVVAGILAIRYKNIAGGLGVFLLALFASILTFGLISPIYLYNHYVPEWIQIEVGSIFSIIGSFSLSVVFFLHVRRNKIAGNLVATGQAKYAYLSQGVAMLLLVYCMLSRLTDVNEGEVLKRNVFWWIVEICLLLFFYYSTEWREKGFVYRGKTIPFTDIVHAQWDGHWSNARLKIKLTNNEQELAFTVPAEMAPAIDNYLRANFPHP
jgi:hypothetical protein